ncbi:Centromere protein C [Phytophthora nicotianae]|uniref:Centromere protein C n=1 Tax=Phytophthora nicotianae TaxID=4792 RepID=A0A0W8D4R0_PHYNI|nr:Centromere protein C [Phytophthora nicotianae]
MQTWEAFGAGLAVVASIVSNLGVNIQKYSHSNEAARPVRERRPYIRRPVWWVGFALVVLGSVGDFAAFGFATQSLVAALGGGATLVANVVTAQCLNGERLYKTDVGGVLFVIMGVVMIACIAEPNVEYPLPELELRFVRTPDDEAAARESRVPYYYAICSGIVGAMTVLLAKCSAIMIALTLKGENQFKYGLTYIFLGGMFVCILVQTHFLNMATALGDIMTVFPIFQACWITFSVVGGAIFYQNDDEPFPTTDKVFYPLALLSITVGVGLLVQHNSSVEYKTNGGKPGAKTRSGMSATSDEDDEILLDADASMSSPLLPAGSREDEGYLHLSP